ncbi:MAG: serine--tRNA ligase [Spirochaetota bacterium]|nr:serine--tRNA ligase [Spirochaetota bacterium]
MLDINKLAKNTDQVKNLLKFRTEINQIDEALIIDEERKKAQLKADELRNRRNDLSKEIGTKKGAGDHEGAEQLLKEAELIKKDMSALEECQTINEDHLKKILEKIPNIPMEDVPVGKEESDNIEIKKHGTPKEFSFEPLSHVDLLTNLNMWEPERATKITGRGFPVLRNLGARLETALINFMLDHNISFGAEQIWVPFVVADHSLYGTGQLPKFGEDLFKLEDSNLYLNPTAEVALTNIYREEIMDISTLPSRFTAYSPSFRKEAGNYGKDTKGLIRVHQFNKVELVTICKAEESEKEHQRMLETSEAILQKLELPYRVVVLSQGDMGFSAAKTYDIEVWLPSFRAYREIASISNCLDFQARRANIRYKPENAKKTEFVHTLNGSALAVGRTLVAILENHQQADGSIIIPKKLQDYFKMDRIEKL